MIDSPAFANFINEFSNAWLDFRLLPATERPADLFPNFTIDLVPQMVTETTTFLANIVKKGAKVDEILTSDYTYTNGNLRKYYNMGPPAEDTPGFDLSMYAGTKRRGILSHASVLTALGSDTRTSGVASPASRR